MLPTRVFVFHARSVGVCSLYLKQYLTFKCNVYFNVTVQKARCFKNLILKAEVRRRVCGKLPLLVKRGSVRIPRSVSLKHMVPTFKTTVLLSDRPGTDDIPVGDRDNSTLCETGRVFLARTPLPSRFSPSLFARCGSWLGHLWGARAHGVESAVAGVSPKASLIYLIIFQEVTFFFFLEVLVVLVAGWVSPAHQLLADWDCMMVAPQWNNWPVPSTLQPGTMKPGNRTLKFVILTALQAVSVFMSACDGLLSGSAEGKMRWRSELSLNRAQR